MSWIVDFEIRLHRILKNNAVIFGAAIDTVPLQAVSCCGGQLLVPVVVYEACNMLKSHIHIEGLFRKAGSQSRQKEIRRSLDSGGRIDKSCHAVDIASILKLYLRVLPEPIIGNGLQEVFLRCLLLTESIRLKSIQNALLLVPIQHLHILHYVMEFFKFVSMKSDVNRMDANNLAIVLAPSIMPPPQSSPPQRMEQHVRFIKILIENANMIGRVSDDVVPNMDSEREKVEEQRIKKKRRSGSLTRMLSGLRKIVTGASHPTKVQTPDPLCTPVLNKGSNKRKQDPQQGFSAKKRKEILDNLPQRMLTCTPIRTTTEKEHKKLRLSIGRKSKDKPVNYEPAPLITFSGNNQSDHKSKEKVTPNAGSIFTTELMNEDLSNSKDCDYVRISKSEYEAIKNRVSAIEDSISQEFKVIGGISHISLNEPVRQVQTAYEKTLEEAAMLASPGSEQLAKRLSRELKIRHSAEHKIIRSPSARKIGTIRRRSRENVTKLTRTQTWNVPNPQPVVVTVRNNQFYPQATLKRGRPNTIHTGLHQPSPAAVNTNVNVNPSIPARRRETFHDSPTVSQPQVNVPVNHSYFTRNIFKRASSFHGQSALNPVVNAVSDQIDSGSDLKWKSANSFATDLENVSNPLTGRASVAKLRSQNAGMVLAKARLFDGMTDSDTSIEKNLEPKPVVRHATGFARKPRKFVSPEMPKRNTNASLDSDSSTSAIEYRQTKKSYKSPGYVSKRPRNKIVRSPLTIAKSKENLNLSNQLKEVIYDVCTPLSEKLNNPSNEENKTPLRTGKVNGTKTPRKTPPIKKLLSVKSSKTFKAVQSVVPEGRKANTPLRANHGTPRRQSPRFVAIKARQLV